MLKKKCYARLFKLRMSWKTVEYVQNFLYEVYEVDRALVHIEDKTTDLLARIIEFKLYEHAIMFVERTKEEYKKYPECWEEKLSMFYSWLGWQDYFFNIYTRWIYEMVEKMIERTIDIAKENKPDLFWEKTNRKIRKMLKEYWRYDTLTPTEYSMVVDDDLF